MEKPTIIKSLVKKLKKQIKNVDGIKYLYEAQIKLIRLTIKERAMLDYEKGNITSVKR